MKNHSLLLAAALLCGAGIRLQAAAPTLVWSDEFNQAESTGPDPAKWSFDLGRGHPPGWGNDELETYTDSRDNALIVSDPAATDGKALAIRARRSGGLITSARIRTESKFSFRYGRLEARARVPKGAGCWPAFWAIGANKPLVGWPACGEIDVMEWVGAAPGRIKGSLHAYGYSGGRCLNADCVLPNGASYSDAYHVFAVDWYPEEIRFLMDGAVYEIRRKSDLPAGSQWPYDRPFFILLNFAVGGRWPGPPDAKTIFPQDYRIDYVRVYKLPGEEPGR